ncbi:hypothetical protein, partial [Muribaculum intestinale]|uniref:hypothetical protein n=1 Tax=Muribaculum intestinale TaxID=1796646 RepID=UPI0025A2BED6
LVASKPVDFDLCSKILPYTCKRGEHRQRGENIIVVILAEMRVIYSRDFQSSRPVAVAAKKKSVYFLAKSN